MQDVIGKQLFGPRQQDQGAHISTRLYEIICDKRRHCHDLEMIPMNKLTMNYVIMHLIHAMLKRKKKKPRGDDVSMMLEQTKRGQLISMPRLKVMPHCTN